MLVVSSKLVHRIHHINHFDHIHNWFEEGPRIFIKCRRRKICRKLFWNKEWSELISYRPNKILHLFFLCWLTKLLYCLFDFSWRFWSSSTNFTSPLNYSKKQICTYYSQTSKNKSCCFLIHKSSPFSVGRGFPGSKQQACCFAEDREWRLFWWPSRGGWRSVSDAKAPEAGSPKQPTFEVRGPGHWGHLRTDLIYRM